MLMWTEADLEAFFESGGVQKPACVVDIADTEALSKCQDLAPDVDVAGLDALELESAKSSVDGWVAGGRDGASEAPTVPYAELTVSDVSGLAQEVGVEFVDDDLEAGGDEERTEEADLHTDPISSVPVTPYKPSAPYPGETSMPPGRLG